MSKGQRLGFLAVAAVIAVVAVVLLGGSGDEEPAQTTTIVQPPSEVTATPEPGDQDDLDGPEPTATPEPTPTPRPKPPLLTAGKETELDVTEGDTVRFRVRSDTADHVHVHGYDLFKDVPAGETVTMRFKADITGVFEIELEDTGRPLARLKVEPR